MDKSYHDFTLEEKVCWKFPDGVYTLKIDPNYSAESDHFVQYIMKNKPRAIKLRCCVCDRTLKVAATNEDPIDAVELRGTACDKCDHGGFDQPTYHRKDGSEIIEI